MKEKYMPSFGLVFGYLPGIDKLSSFAGKQALGRRMSVSLDTFNPETGNLYFDANILVQVLEEMLPSSRFDRITVEYDNGKTGVHYQVQGMMDEIRNSTGTQGDSKEQVLINSICFYRDGSTVLYIELENYSSVGGPAPYHDTYNFAFYSHSFDYKAIRKKIMASCLRHGFDLRSIYQGGEEPRFTFQDKLKRLF